MILNDIWTHRNLIKKMAIVDLKRRYKASALSAFWLVITPAIMIFTYWFSFSTSGQYHDTIVINGQQFMRIAWLIVGVLSWNYLGDIIASGPMSLRNYAWVVTKFGVPITIPPIFINLSKAILGFSIIFSSWIINVFIALFGSVETAPVATVYILELPIILFLMFWFMTAWSLFLSPLYAISRDFQNFIGMVPMFVAWVSSVFMPLSVADTSSAYYTIIQINPFYFLITGLRKSILGAGELFTPDGITVQWYSIMSFFIFLIVITAIALFVNKKAKRVVIDLI